MEYASTNLMLISGGFFAVLLVEWSHFVSEVYLIIMSESFLCFSFLFSFSLVIFKNMFISGLKIVSNKYETSSNALKNLVEKFAFGLQFIKDKFQTKFFSILNDVENLKYLFLAMIITFFSFLVFRQNKLYKNVNIIIKKFILFF